MMLYDYDMEKHIESEKAYEYEKGIEKGMEKGMEKGIKLLIGNLMDSMHISETEARKYLKLESQTGL